MTVRKLLFWAHLMAGSVAGLVILVLSLTGVALAFERQINNWSDARIQVPVPSGSPMIPFEQLAKTPGRREGSPPTITVRPQSPVELAFGRERTVFVNPFTGAAVQAPPRGTRQFFGSAERIHRALGGALRNSPGHSVVDASNLLFLFLVTSGLYLWFPRRWTFKAVRPGLWFRRGLSGRARDWNWHNTIGFWCAIPLFFIVLSGVVMSYQWANNLLYQVTGTQPPSPGRPNQGGPPSEQAVRAEHSDLPNAKSVAELLKVVKLQNPKWQSISFQIPRPQDKAMTFTVDEALGGQPQKRWQKTLDRTSAAVLRVEGFETLNAGRKLRTIARFLHTGEILGIPGQIVAAIASAGAVVLVWTGLALALRRLAAWFRRRGRLTPGSRIAEPALTTEA